MAPVTGGIADGEKDGLTVPLCQSKRFLAPRMPIYGVVRVLQEIWTGFVGEAIGHGGLRIQRTRSIVDPE
jgi:hypothetical protein